jgi:hypothetical protein
MSFLPEAHGIRNYLAIFEEDINVLVNTVVHRGDARLDPDAHHAPGRATLERLMERPTT